MKYVYLFYDLTKKKAFYIIYTVFIDNCLTETKYILYSKMA